MAPQAVAKVVGRNTASSGLLVSDGGRTGRHSGEATQDVEVMMSVAPLVPTWFWSTAGHRPAVNGGNNEPFLRWLLDLAATKAPPLVQAVRDSLARDSLATRLDSTRLVLSRSDS